MERRSGRAGTQHAHLALEALDARAPLLALGSHALHASRLCLRRSSPRVVELTRQLIDETLMLRDQAHVSTLEVIGALLVLLRVPATCRGIKAVLAQVRHLSLRRVKLLCAHLSVQEP